ncbi:MAG: hypothetical protein R2736_09355 [Solirubrobacterales bacterium]
MRAQIRLNQAARGLRLAQRSISGAQRVQRGALRQSFRRRPRMRGGQGIRGGRGMRGGQGIRGGRGMRGMRGLR